MNAMVDLSKVVLETDRLILRPWSMDDVDDMFEYASVEGVGEMAGWVHHKDKATTKEIVGMFIKEKKTFAIVYKENNKVIGSLGIENHGRHMDSSFDDLIGRELGYVLSKEYWGLGLMPEAVKKVIDYCFNELKCDFLSCAHFVSNTQSQKVIEKMGFKFYKDIEVETRYGTIEKTKLYVLYSKYLSILEAKLIF